MAFYAYYLYALCIHVSPLSVLAILSAPQNPNTVCIYRVPNFVLANVQHSQFMFPVQLVLVALCIQVSHCPCPLSANCASVLEHKFDAKS